MKNIIKINRNKQYQTFKGFGASGAWCAQIVGGWEHTDPESGISVRDKIAELLFNKEKGIGLQIYRYNLGGGSKNSGKGTFSQPARMAESFDISDTEYDWSRDANAVYMLKQVVKNGADEIIFFVNSPPERFTKNGKAHLDKALHENLSKSKYKEFAEYCLNVTEHFINDGIPVKFLSPVNEPLWIWTGGQEGCHYRPSSVHNVFKVFADALDKRPDLSGLKLSGAENGDIRWFNKSYTYQLLRDKSITKYLDGVDIHSYFLHAPLPFLNNRSAYLKRYRKWMDKHYPDIKLKMSEWTHMKGGRDYGMDSALEMARIMIEDISILNVTSWQHWIAISEVDFCDGLIYINLEDKTFETTKRLYATGNFSKFIHPGSVRIDAITSDSDLQILAFKNEKQTILIIVNHSTEEKTVLLSESQAKNAVQYVTDENRNLEKILLDKKNGFIIPARSVNTLIY